MIRLIPGAQLQYPAPKPLVDPKNKLILFWSHRCGSTSAQRWFFELAGWKHRMPRLAARLFFRMTGNPQRARGLGVGELAQLWYAAHDDIYADLNAVYRDPSYLKIAVVRHPLPRAVSAFSTVIGSKSGLQWQAVARSLLAPDNERRVSFREFVDFLEAIDLATANYHWRLQTAQDWPQVDDVQLVRVEQLKPALDRMCLLLGRKPIRVWNHSAQTKLSMAVSDEQILSYTRADLARVFGFDRRGLIRLPPYASFLTDAVAARLCRVYASDFTRLGYDCVAPSTE